MENQSSLHHPWIEATDSFESLQDAHERLQRNLNNEKVRDSLRESGWTVYRDMRGEWQMIQTGPVHERRCECRS